jgi:hypothetical protein
MMLFQNKTMTSLSRFNGQSAMILLALCVIGTNAKDLPEMDLVKAVKAGESEDLWDAKVLKRTDPVKQAKEEWESEQRIRKKQRQFVIIEDGVTKLRMEDRIGKKTGKIFYKYSPITKNADGEETVLERRKPKKLTSNMKGEIRFLSKKREKLIAEAQDLRNRILNNFTKASFWSDAHKKFNDAEKLLQNEIKANEKAKQDRLAKSKEVTSFRTDAHKHFNEEQKKVEKKIAADEKAKQDLQELSDVYCNSVRHKVMFGGKKYVFSARYNYYCPCNKSDDANEEAKFIKDTDAHRYCDCAKATMGPNGLKVTGHTANWVVENHETIIEDGKSKANGIIGDIKNKRYFLRCRMCESSITCPNRKKGKCYKRSVFQRVLNKDDVKRFQELKSNLKKEIENREERLKSKPLKLTDSEKERCKELQKEMKSLKNNLEKLEAGIDNRRTRDLKSDLRGKGMRMEDELKDLQQEDRHRKKLNDEIQSVKDEFKKLEALGIDNECIYTREEMLTAEQLVIERYFQRTQQLKNKLATLMELDSDESSESQEQKSTQPSKTRKVPTQREQECIFFLYKKLSKEYENFVIDAHGFIQRNFVRLSDSDYDRLIDANFSNTVKLMENEQKPYQDKMDKVKRIAEKYPKRATMYIAAYHE